MSTSHAPCAACKCRRQKCTQECIFAPYFPPEDPQKFINVHKVFGASNVAKLLNELNPNQREDAVNSLAYEAQYRLQDPVYGCVGLVSILQHKLRQVQHDLECAKKELATYIGPSAMLPMLNHHGLLQQQQNFGHSVYQMMPYHLQQMMLPMTGPHGRQFINPEPQQLTALADVQQQQQGQQNDDGGDFVADFNQMAKIQPSLALSGSNESETNHLHFDQSNPLSHSQHYLQQQQSVANHHHLQQKQQQLVQTQGSHAQQQTQRATSIGLSC